MNSWASRSAVRSVKTSLTAAAPRSGGTAAGAPSRIGRCGKTCSWIWIKSDPAGSRQASPAGAAHPDLPPAGAEKEGPRRPAPDRRRGKSIRRTTSRPPPRRPVGAASPASSAAAGRSLPARSRGSTPTIYDDDYRGAAAAAATKRGPYRRGHRTAPRAVLILVLGIISVVCVALSFCYGIGVPHRPADGHHLLGAGPRRPAQDQKTRRWTRRGLA